VWDTSLSLPIKNIKGNNMTNKIFRSILLVAVTVLLASIAITIGILYDYLFKMQKDQLKTQTLLASQAVANEGMAYFDGLSTNDNRITWISRDGTILFDSRKTAENTDPLEAEEIREAIENGYGESSRFSEEIMQDMIYSAKKLPDGSVIRLADSQLTLLTIILSMAQPITVVIAAALILSAVLASGVAKKLVKPLNEIDLNRPMANVEYKELLPLMQRIQSQQNQLAGQSEELRRRRDEFNAATDKMTEGLIITNEKDRIVSINRAAAEILNTGKYCTGLELTAAVTEADLSDILSKTKTGAHSETLIEKNDRIYQFNASPVISDRENIGAVIIVFDITEKVNSEKMRREFTANVSHELKTPLHSISGCAELLSNGLVKAEDVPEFSRQIYSEAKRMISLVNDIIKLSMLDEGAAEKNRTETDIHEISAGVISSLRVQAEHFGITLFLVGETCIINGIPYLIECIIYNLCENAIKYNVPDGSVRIETRNAGDTVILTVTDTGIGIPAEYKERIFERFYRIDKSHSKQVGGTGLGLSIVKRAARLHDAKISLDSTVGKGTKITVRFPKNTQNQFSEKA